MGKTNALLHSFNTGELSVAGIARVDQDRARLGAEIQENILPHVVGKGQIRGGTEYIGNTVSNVRPRLIPFVKSVSQTALLELTDSLLRVWVGDELVTRPVVSSTVTNGDFSSATGWTLTTTGGGLASISGGLLTLSGVNRGGLAICTRQVSTSSAGTEHALNIVVTRGPVLFRCGSTDGGDDYIRETTLDTGVHSLAFTPSGSYWVRFFTPVPQNVIVDSIAVASAGVMTLTAPWTLDQLREITYSQSGDVVFLAHGSWQQRRIERRATRSWSLVLYKTDDGPFLTAASAKLSLTPSATRGNITLTASQTFFRPEHVGCLFRLSHTRFNATFGLADNEQFTDSWQVNGIGEDNQFQITRSGTWSGTLTLQRSYDGPDAGFIDIGNYTNNGTVSPDPGDLLNNVIHWYRIGFRTTDSGPSYTSGVAVIKVVYSGYSGSGVVRVTGYTSPTSVDAEVVSDLKMPISTEDWLEGAWSDFRGWPTAVTFFDGRLWWAGEDRIWGSESDNYTAFNLDTEGDAGSVQRNVATGGSVSSVAWMLPLGRLILGTEHAAVSARSSSFDEPLTPTNVTMKDASTLGTAKISPVTFDSRGLYVQRSTTKIAEIAYNFEANDYVSNDVTRLNEDIAGDGIVELAVQRQPEPYVWMVREDGVCPFLLYSPSEEVAGFFKFIAAPCDAGDAEVESVCILPELAQDRVYLAVKRTINGSTVRFIEKLAKHSEARGDAINLMADAYVFSAGPVSSITAAHLANEGNIVGWGTTNGVSGPITGKSADGFGVVDLGATYTNVLVGLPYDWRYKSAKLAYGAESGSAILQPKQVRSFGLLLADTHRDAIDFGRDFTHTETFKLRDEAGQSLTDANAVVDVYDSVARPFPGSWTTDSRLCLKGSAPYPATLLGLLMTVETNERV